ncbi:hypothetical protein, partial [Escherichia coli]|uniref:hypothetical protein n=1 Tax=Escherichia coli TaxID=562 RepID=UPI0022AC038A
TFLLAIIAIAAAVIVGLVPSSETFSDDGYGVFGRVDINCGSVLSSGSPSLDFADSMERAEYENSLFYGDAPAWFEGQTADQVCDDQLDTARTSTYALFGAGGVLLVVALFRTSGRQHVPKAAWSQPSRGVDTIREDASTP